MAFKDILKKLNNLSNAGSGSSESMQKFFSFYKRFSVSFFGSLTDRYLKDFEHLRKHIRGAGIMILLKTWVSAMFMTSTLTYIVSLIATILYSFFMGFDIITSIYYIIFVPIMAAAGVFIIFYIYPIQKANSIKTSIDNNLPFALSHMSAIASSGIPPEYMFQLLVDFKEYGDISKQASMVVRNIKTFGMSSLNAMKDVSLRTPSDNFREVLTGMATTIEKGGNLINYVEDMSKQQLFQYKIKRERYLKTLSTYADIYTALLVAAPLMMLATLGVMGIIGGEIFGLTIEDLMFLITWIALPSLNVMFLAFVHMTYPGL